MSNHKKPNPSNPSLTPYSINNARSRRSADRAATRAARAARAATEQNLSASSSTPPAVDYKANLLVPPSLEDLMNLLSTTESGEAGSDAPPSATSNMGITDFASQTPPVAQRSVRSFEETPLPQHLFYPDPSSGLPPLAVPLVSIPTAKNRLAQSVTFAHQKPHPHCVTVSRLQPAQQGNVQDVAGLLTVTMPIDQNLYASRIDNLGNPQLVLMGAKQIGLQAATMHLKQAALDAFLPPASK